MDYDLVRLVVIVVEARLLTCLCMVTVALGPSIGPFCARAVLMRRITENGSLVNMLTMTGAVCF